MKDSLSILLVEDDPDDIELLQEALNMNNVAFDMSTIRQGDHVLTYLEQCSTFPDLLVLDLNLPKMSGREILQRIKSSPAFMHIPVVIFTTSSSVTDMNECMAMNADRFITKPSSVEGYNLAIRTMLSLATTAF